ncbi:tRNA (cytosine(32)/uridine(32)-2'-O)-methyltransferase TrmJ [Candidatus Endobugula sertula]|uniref:tRNA (cytidine/uridine-2'-O-)-methyltransferase TrmJ n=1 Tax=Candidatus Endobugula sertula TaxID=62101 RepID=A0A1D2QP43_9GAMM|nr:tRNA (cytosine(32)/uridine(32)-2'-O)-methyltransferase TrmJ [Candidatus Endobugula sertula]
MTADQSVLSPESQQALASIRIVLVETTHPGNIGGVARAMKNMGLSQLYLVSPKDYPAQRAEWRASNAQDVLRSASVVDSLDDAIADCGLVIGTSARERRIPWPLVTPRECADYSCHEASTHPVAIIFGREDRGLTNEELHKCHYHLHIPANPEYSSLNLAAAVQVIAYELRMTCLNNQRGKSIHFDDWDMPPAKSEALEHYYEHLQETLEKIGFLEPDNPRQTMTRLRRLYHRVRLDEMELNILRGVLTAMQNYVYFTDKKLAKLEEKN